MTDAQRFRNALAILISLDRDTLEKAGIITVLNPNKARWRLLLEDPARFALALPTSRLEALWRLIETRQPEDE